MGLAVSLPVAAAPPHGYRKTLLAAFQNVELPKFTLYTHTRTVSQYVRWYVRWYVRYLRHRGTAPKKSRKFSDLLLIRYHMPKVRFIPGGI